MKLVLSFLSLIYVVLCGFLGLYGIHWWIKETVISSLVAETFARSEVKQLEQLSNLRELLGRPPLELSLYKDALKLLTSDRAFAENIRKFPFVDTTELDEELKEAKERLILEKKLEAISPIRELLSTLLGVSSEPSNEILFKEGVLAGLPSLIALPKNLPNLASLRDALKDSTSAPIWSYDQKQVMQELESLRAQTEKALKNLKIGEPELPEGVINSLRAQLRRYLIEKTDQIQVNFFSW